MVAAADVGLDAPADVGLDALGPFMLDSFMTWRVEENSLGHLAALDSLTRTVVATTAPRCSQVWISIFALNLLMVAMCCRQPRLISLLQRWQSGAC